MKEGHSRLLQVVIAAMLINVAPDGRAETYDLPSIGARYPDEFWDDYAYFDAGYDNWDFNDYYEQSDSGNEDSDNSEAMDPEKQAQCDAIAAKVSSACDLSNPPLSVTNGCGSGITTNLVPDYLIVNGVPVYRLGPIFQGACNLHDECYGTYPADKEACDLTLNTNMINHAQLTLSDWQWTVYGPFVRAQALGYSAGLQAPFISSVSGAAFDGAQLDGACRAYAGIAKDAGCID